MTTRPKLKILKNNDSWFAEGLRFECTGCGQCCTGSPGYVWVTENEIEEIALFLNLTTKEFIQRFVRRVDGRFSLLEHPKNFDCVFLKGKKCQIYSVRPTQCQTFPWWPQHLQSNEDWQRAATFCEGISENAPLIPIEHISEQLETQIEYNNR